MRSKVVWAACFLFSSGSVQGKEKLFVEEKVQDKMVTRPKCGEATCGLCALDDEFNQVCLNYGATMKVGWKFDQDWYDDPLTIHVLDNTGLAAGVESYWWDGYYDWTLEIYAEVSADAGFLLNIDRLWYALLEFWIEEFKASIGLRFKYWHQSRFTCYGVYLGVEDFQMQLTLRMKWMDCYKDFIETLWCWDNWFGRDAKIFELCNFSVPELIDLWKYDVTIGTTNPYYVAGGGGMEDPTVGTCLPGLLWTEKNPLALPNIM
jgi:hypothetical protein